MVHQEHKTSRIEYMNDLQKMEMRARAKAIFQVWYNTGQLQKICGVDGEKWKNINTTHPFLEGPFYEITTKILIIVTLIASRIFLSALVCAVSF